MICRFVDEGRGPDMPEIIQKLCAHRGNEPLYFYRVNVTIWYISDTPISKDEVDNEEKAYNYTE